MRIPALAATMMLAPALLVAQAPSDSAQVMAVVHQVFDAMRARDSTSLRATFAADARMLGAGDRNGTVVVENDAPDGFITAVGKPSPAMWDERIYNPEVRIDGRLAMVWTEYDFYLGDKFSHCGVDLFQLLKTADGWKIITLADTRRREGCPTR